MVMAGIRMLHQHLLAFQNPFFIPLLVSQLVGVPCVPAVLLLFHPIGTTDGRPSSAPRPRGMAAGIGTTRIPPPAAGIPAGAPRAILPVSGAGAGTAAVGTHPRGARGGRGAGAGPLHPAGPGNATTPIRTERKLGRCFPWRSHRDCLFYKVI